MKKIKARWPDQVLILVCRKGIGEFFLKTKLVDEVCEIRKGDRGSYKSVVQTLNAHTLDKIFSPHESWRTAMFVRKLRAKDKIAFSKFWNFAFFNQRIRKNLKLPDPLRQLSLLEKFDSTLAQQIQSYAEGGQPYISDSSGVLSAPPAWSSMSLLDFYRGPAANIDATLAKLNLTSSELKNSVAFFPGSVWATKRWTEEGFVQTGQKLAEDKIPVLIMGGPGEEQLCGRVAAQIPGAVSLCGRTSIFESALVISRVAAVVGNDSASMHLAATAETPSVVIFGPTVIEFGFRPWQDKVYVVEKSGLACRPCGKHGHQVCPIGTHVCMKGLQKEDVLKKLQEILK